LKKYLKKKKEKSIWKRIKTQGQTGITSPWFVERIEFNQDEKRLDIYINFKRGSKLNYFDDKNNKEFFNLSAYDTTTKRWRHLNFFEYECYLHARIPRVKLPDGTIKTIKAPWEGVSSGFSLLFEALLLQLCSSMPVNQVSKLINPVNHLLINRVNAHNDKIWDMLDRYINKAKEHEDFSDIDSVGIDETSIAKGHKYITLFVDLNKRRTLFVAEGKDALTVKEFAKDFKKHNAEIENIQNVSCDMSFAFIKGVREYMPNADITFDKFHILKIINEAVDSVRKQEAKENKLLKQTKYIWLKNKQNLTRKQKETLKELTISNMNLKTARAYNIRQSFQDIYNTETEEEFIIYLKKWYFWATHSRLKPIVESARTIKKHWHGIINWFKSKINNGILEGLNSVIQAAKAKARGYRTFKNYRIIVYLLTGKLDFNLVNKNLRGA